MGAGAVDCELPVELEGLVLQPLVLEWVLVRLVFVVVW